MDVEVADEPVTVAPEPAAAWPEDVDCGNVSPVVVVPASLRQRERVPAGRVLQLAAGGVLVAHGLAHLAWFVRQDDEGWPFRLESDWLLREELWRPAATALVLFAAVGFVLLGLAVARLPRVPPVGPGLVAPAAAASLLVTVLFWDPVLLSGAVLDVAAVVGAWWWAEWRAQWPWEETER